MARTNLDRFRLPVAAGFAAAVAMIPLAGCDRTESRSKSETTRTTETPDATKKTTETIEKKTVTDPK
jgi:hypothetical protein